MTFQSCRAQKQGAGLRPCLFCLIRHLWQKKAQNHTRCPVFDALLLAALHHRIGFSTGNMRRRDARESVLPHDIAAAVYALLPSMETNRPQGNIVICACFTERIGADELQASGMVNQEPRLLGRCAQAAGSLVSRAATPNDAWAKLPWPFGLVPPMLLGPPLST
jgi:hypothetical protein